MTVKEAINILKNEKCCILVADKDECTRECSKCDLVMETDVLLTAYDTAIKALEKLIPKKPITTEDGNKACSCGLVLQTEHKRRCLYYCDNCGQAIDWSEEE